MTEIAPGVHHIPLMLRAGINAYIAGGAIVDAGIAPHGKRIAEYVAKQGVPVDAHVITHAHGDHVGGSKSLLGRIDVPLAVGEKDADAVASGVPVTPPNSKLAPVLRRVAGFAAVPVARRLVEGDAVGDFVVLDTPGHSPGHISLWRESDRVLICGDVFFGMNIFTTQPGLHQPLGLVTPDPERNRDSERKLAALEPDIVCFGHGPVMHDAAPKLTAFVAKLG
jgi:hydroxyacylglutathione hydrolase